MTSIPACQLPEKSETRGCRAKSHCTGEQRHHRSIRAPQDSRCRRRPPARPPSTPRPRPLPAPPRETSDHAPSLTTHTGFPHLASSERKAGKSLSRQRHKYPRAIRPPPPTLHRFFLLRVAVLRVLFVLLLFLLALLLILGLRRLRPLLRRLQPFTSSAPSFAPPRTFHLLRPLTRATRPPPPTPPTAHAAAVTSPRS